ncbi:hypothetical protein ATE49_15485 [Elizabethkingia miricola]|uniref:Uncharacterized protein n=1 Tax=Elizabethkingia miricola TaxID=172045 RepID=A0ABY3NAD3_ELIMR|nr:hypothetical protein [Elizabethkingia miricola]OBS12785.1 hypothetical protein ATE49_15485 [Elizabethkingia miricola]TYO83767.1 hypothetical protein LX74_04044 [Elizabethkingia miricola]
MKRLEEIKNEVAKELEYANWEVLKNGLSDFKIGICYEEVAKRYAREVAQASLEKAAENANIKYHDGHNKLYKAVKHVQIGADNIQIDKESITNESNIVML